MADLVRGEASESDEDTNNEQLLPKTDVFATEVSGEATESDEDVYEKNYSANKNPTRIYMDSLLQRKLIDTNFSLWKSLTAFIKQSVTSASKQLLTTDQLLIKSQVSIQSVISSMKMARVNVKQLHEKYEDVFTTNFIPSISIQTEL